MKHLAPLLLIVAACGGKAASTTPGNTGGAASYGAGEWSHIDHALLDELDTRICGFAGKSVLDLGGGPGQYTMAMAQRGARVTWHDVSRTYLEMSRGRAESLGLTGKVTFSLGYLDEAPRLAPQPPERRVTLQAAG